MYYSNRQIQELRLTVIQLERQLEKERVMVDKLCRQLRNKNDIISSRFLHQRKMAFKEITNSPQSSPGRNRNKFNYLQSIEPKENHYPKKAVARKLKIERTLDQKLQLKKTKDEISVEIKTQQKQDNQENNEENIERQQGLGNMNGVKKKYFDEDLHISRFEKYFTGEVLDEENDYKEFLANLVEREFGRRIKRTKLLFRHEKRTNRNLHPFVDGRAPFVLVVKTAEDYCFAGLSEGAISAQSLERGRGWLISLSNQRAFASIPGKFAVQHDNVYLIFGNQQIRVAGNSDVVFSNFGISNAYYDTRGKVQEFLGPGASDNFREAELKSFEVFEIVFE